jgi:protein neuralized
MYGVNGEDIGIFFTGVATNTPLWALMDIYGNTIEIEFIKLGKSPNG